MSSGCGLLTEGARSGGGAASAVTAGSVAHAPAATVLQRWANSEEGLTCDVTCNEDTAEGVHPGASWPLYSCWGTFKAECEKKHESKHGTSVTRTLTKCEGAFTSLRKESSEDNNSAATSAFGDIAGHHHGHEGLEGKNLTFVACEGKYFNLVKTLPQNAGSDAAVHDFAGAEQLLDSENFGEGAASAGSKWQRSGLAGADNASAKASIMAQGCSGTLKAVIVSPAEKNVTAFVTCSGGYVEGKGGKSVGTVNEKLHAEMDRVSANLERKFMRGTPHLQHFTNRAGAATTVSSNEALDMAEASLASGVSAVPHLTDVNGGECKPTCNHKPLAWHGYWPCKGELNFKCSGNKTVKGEDVCYLVNFKCLGVSWPAFKFCHGLFEARFEAGGETEEDGDWFFEKFDLTHGSRKAKKFSKDGWEGMVSFAGGSSSSRIKFGVDEGSKKHHKRDGKDVGNVMADALLATEDA